MQLSRVYFALLGLVILVVVVFQISLKSLTDPAKFAGCPALSATGEVDPTDTVAFWNNQTLSPPLALSGLLSPEQIRVLGTTTDEKWIEIDLANQKLIAHQGDKIFLESLISSGLWNRTPAGEFRIWYKIKSTKMEGGSKLNKTYYYLPNVPYDMFFNGDIGIHGTYWHSNFGRPMSHGCVNAPTPVAEQLFYWTDPQLPPGKNLVRATPDNPGTRVVVHK